MLPFPLYDYVVQTFYKYCVKRLNGFMQVNTTKLILLNIFHKLPKKEDHGEDKALFTTLVLHQVPILQPPCNQQLS